MFPHSGITMASSTSPGQSSPESLEVEDDSNHTPAQWQSHDNNNNKNNNHSPDDNAASSSQQQQQQPRPTAPMQKRRRVTRACDECRRKKIKCDGKQPCTHCTVYSYDCTYDQPSNRRRNPAPQYIEALENRLQRAETLLRTLIPSIDLNDPNFDSLAKLQAHSPVSTSTPEPTPKHLPQGQDVRKDAQIQSMIQTTGSLDLDDRGYWDFHGGSSGAVFLKRMKEQFGGLLGEGSGIPFPKIAKNASGAQVFESPVESPMDSGLPNTLDLPTKETARILSTNALQCACALIRFVHQPTFNVMFDRIYDLPAETYGDEEHRFLPLLYSVLALGCMFAPGNPNDAGKLNYKDGIDQGVKYFRAARSMMDITDCRDVVSLQAIIFMIMFLQSSANLSTCYSFIGVALRSAVRMGLHRNLSSNFNPIERETRRRVFWVIRKMDTYVAALLGFPKMLNEEDVDQELPIEVDDEYITATGILPMPEGKISLYAASNAHTKLMVILAKVIKFIYPIKGLESCLTGNNSGSSSYNISHLKIKEIECDLQEWLDKLPMALRPGGDAPPETVRVQQLLRLGYAHVQMMLYRPFLHYVSPKSYAGKTVDDRSYACAAACVSVARNIVHITAEMKRRGLLIGAYWFTMYTTFFAILSLVFFVLENPDKPGSQEILADAFAGREALAGLAKRSMAADRCTTSLGGLFEKLPERLKQGRPEASPVTLKKKRSAPSNTPVVSRGIRSSPDVSQQQPTPLTASQRASTFPNNNTNINTHAHRSSGSFEANHFQPQQLQGAYRDHLVSPNMTNANTSDSSSTNSSMQFGPLQQSFTNEVNGNLPDLTRMMFPSNDPFAYPNQPMMEFDNLQDQKSQQAFMSPPNMYMSNGNSGPYDNLEGQLFGPLPPYLSQGQADVNMGNMDVGGMNVGIGQPQIDMNMGVTPTTQMNFDEIFGGNSDDWNNMLAGDSGFRL